MNIHDLQKNKKFICVHLPTIEEASKFIKICHKNEFNSTDIANWSKYKEHTCFTLYGMYGDVRTLDTDWTILSMSELTKILRNKHNPLDVHIENAIIELTSDK